ncbi:hypothetical protein BN135_3293 [Cronobacter muytjensii 530]
MTVVEEAATYRPFLKPARLEPPRQPSEKAVQIWADNKKPPCGGFFNCVITQRQRTLSDCGGD